jgi:hypothetical protein
VAAAMGFINTSLYRSTARNEYGAVAHDSLDDLASEVLAGDGVFDVDAFIDSNGEFCASRDCEIVGRRRAGLFGSTTR